MLSFLAAAQPETAGAALRALSLTPRSLLLVWLAGINLFAFALFGADKAKAVRSRTHPGVRRIPERSLFLAAILGGSAGALLGMRVWHHKTLHRSFRIGIPLILFLQILIPAGLYLYWKVIR